MGKQGVARKLWDYRAEKASQAAMREELAGLQSVRGHDYEAHPVNGISDPVAEVTNRIMNLEARIQKSERKTRPVERLLSDLDVRDERMHQMREILRLRYIVHESHDAVKQELSISGSTYWRRRCELLRLAGKYFGMRE